MSDSELTKLTQGIFELKVAVENMAEKQQEMVSDVKQIKEAVYNPDSGIYARLRVRTMESPTTKERMGCYGNPNWLSDSNGIQIYLSNDLTYWR